MWSVKITPGGDGSPPSLSVAPVSSLTLSPPRGCGASAQPRTRYLSASSPLEGDRVDVGGVVVEGKEQLIHGGATGASHSASPGCSSGCGVEVAMRELAELGACIPGTPVGEVPLRGVLPPTSPGKFSVTWAA